MATARAHAADPLGYYAVLGVAPDASQEEIRRAFRREARRWHPDRNSSPDAAERMARLNEAYDTLSDPRRRAAYDCGAFSHSGAEAEPPRPVVCPAILDFGRLQPGERSTQTVRVANAGGPCGTVRAEPEFGTWFRLAGARGSASPDIIAELDFEGFVEPAAGMAPGRRRKRVRVFLDGEAAELALTLTVLGSRASGGGTPKADPPRGPTPDADPPASPSPPLSAFAAYVERSRFLTRWALALIAGVGAPWVLASFGSDHPGLAAPLYAMAAAMLLLAVFAAFSTRVFTRVASASAAGQFAAAATLWLGKAAIAAGLIAVVVFVLVGILMAVLAIAIVVLVLGAMLGAVVRS